MQIEPREGWEVTVCAASGPSFSVEQAAFIFEAHRRGLCKVAAVNDSWLRVPFADLLYACDGEWWEKHYGYVRSNFKGECWTQAQRHAHRFGLNHIAVDTRGEGLTKSRSLVHGGGNGGYQLVNLVYLFGAKKIILVGYDLQPTGGRKHWFGDHPPGLNRDSPYSSWVRRFEVLVADLQSAGVEIVNSTEQSALRSAPRVPLENVLCLTA